MYALYLYLNEKPPPVKDLLKEGLDINSSTWTSRLQLVKEEFLDDIRSDIVRVCEDVSMYLFLYINI